MTNRLITRYEDLLGSVDREGINNLISFIQKSDFYTAPASTKYHSSYEGGLLQHSLNVYDRLNKKYMEDKETWHKENDSVTADTLKIVALLHDICKAYFYKVSYRNSKNEETGKWEKVPFYTVDDRFPYGHGEKSVMMISEFIKLTPIEKYAIRWHMGFTEPKENWNTFSSAVRKYPLVLALHLSDLEATYLLEEET